MESYPTVGDAFGAGDITREHAAIITRAVERVPSSVDQATRDELLADLVARAVEQRPAPKRLRGWARRMCDKISPDLGDQQEHDVVNAEEDCAARLHTPSQRAALSARYDACAAAGRERPFAWREIHHPHSCADEGGTDLGNVLPLCSWHHHRAHDPAYHHELTPTGEIEYTRQRQRLRPTTLDQFRDTEIPAGLLLLPA